MTRAAVHDRNRPIANGEASLSPRLRRFLDRFPTWLLFLVAGLWTLPGAGFVVSSLRRWPEQEAGWWTNLLNTETWTLDAYRSALSVSVNNSFADGLFNSLAIAVPATLIPLFIASLAAYAIGWIPFRGKTFTFFGLVALMALPVQAVLIPLLQTYSGGAHISIPILDKTVTVFPDLDVAGTLPAVWLTHIGFALPFSIFLLTVAMTRLPRSLIDAARADGASHLQIFWHVATPLAIPTVAGLGVLLFLWSWNEYLIGLTMIGGGNPAALPATVRLVAYSVPTGGASIAAAACLHSAVSIGVFLSLHRYFARALVLSAE
ncbi:MAG: carbohydrate ABC transporter permease [bacterium]|nr:carbohydrate ABC transporter permease [bacterium]